MNRAAEQKRNQAGAPGGGQFAPEGKSTATGVSLRLSSPGPPGGTRRYDRARVISTTDTEMTIDTEVDVPLTSMSRYAGSPDEANAQMTAEAAAWRGFLASRHQVDQADIRGGVLTATLRRTVDRDRSDDLHGAADAAGSHLWHHHDDGELEREFEAYMDGHDEDVQDGAEHAMETALWVTDAGDSDEPLNEQYDVSNIDTATREQIEEEFGQFVLANRDLVDRYQTRGGTIPQLAHDYVLARNQTGSGFIDRPCLDDLNDRLQAAATSQNPIDLYVGDDHTIYRFG